MLPSVIAQARPKRQFDSGGGPAQIDLNITVPFIFSARLYPYGEDKGDKSLEPYSKTQAFVTKHELAFLEDNVTVLYVSVSVLDASSAWTSAPRRFR